LRHKAARAALDREGTHPSEKLHAAIERIPRNSVAIAIAPLTGKAAKARVDAALVRVASGKLEHPSSMPAGRDDVGTWAKVMERVSGVTGVVADECARRLL